MVFCKDLVNFVEKNSAMKVSLIWNKITILLFGWCLLSTQLSAQNRCGQAMSDFNREVSTIRRGLPPLMVLEIQESFVQTAVNRVFSEWHKTFNEKQFDQTLKVIKKGKAGKAERQQMVLLKEKGTAVRHIFEIFTAAHEIPPGFQFMIKKVGEIKDFLKNDRHDKAAKAAKKLRSYMKEYSPETELSSFTPLTAIEVREYLQDRISHMRSLIQETKLTPSQTVSGYEFHHMKKTVRAVDLIYFLMLEAAKGKLTPAEQKFGIQFDQMVRVMGGISESLSPEAYVKEMTKTVTRLHDSFTHVMVELVAQKIHTGVKLKHYNVELKGIQDDLTQILDQIIIR